MAAENSPPCDDARVCGQNASGRSQSLGIIQPALLAALALVLSALFSRPVLEMINTWSLMDSYYTHGFLIAPISAYILWLRRRAILAVKLAPDPCGYFFIALAGLMLLGGAFLGFRVFEQAALIPMLAGVCLVIAGRAMLRAVLFPLLFLAFMIPLPGSVTQSAAFNIKMVAAEGAVFLTNLAALPIIRQGSYIYFNGDHLIIGEVCGGLRSLIALLALGALLAYWSKTRAWARVALFLTAVPVAIVSNVFRIFLLCVVGYFFGSENASGTVHDVSGILIFVVAFGLFLGLDAVFRKLAPASPENQP